MSDADPMTFLRAILLDADGTELEDVPIRVGKLENTDLPPVVLLEDSGWIHETQVGAFLPARISVSTYGRTEYEAALLFRAAMNLLPSLALRVIDGVGSGRAFDETGPQPRDDPDTHWPARFGVVRIVMPDRVLVAAS